LSNQNHYDLDEDESSEDEIFFSFGQIYNSNSLKELSHSNIQSNMQNVNSYLDIQSDETHLIRWLEVRKDIVLVLTSICSLPSIISNQVSSNCTPNLAKILFKQSRILFLWIRVPMKRTRTSLIKSVIPNMVKTHPDWNGISTKLRQAFENFHSTYNDDISKLNSSPVLCKKHIDALDYNIFKNQQSGVKALEALVTRSLKIHVEYLILESKGKDPDYTFTVLNHDLNNNNLNPQISHPLFSNELNNSSCISNQQFELNCKIDDDQQSYYGSIDQEDRDQDMSSCNLYDMDNMEFDQKFDDNLDYGNLESIYENEFSDNINSNSLDDECEPISNNMDEEPKTFDRTKPDIN
ncbi:39064_t:CDS:2, partial [Gigaspora margarita]